ncbi:MAG: NADH-quinone oxidoreductase subunit M, partial [Bacteroidales bacterium]|nr:NADH-quinone oxidoreductase subunit M [Bacteroidales bacterium]
HIKNYLMPAAAQRVFAPMVIAGFGILGALFPFSILFPAGTYPAPLPVRALFYGVTMKLGVYGALKLVIGIMPEGAGSLSNLILILSAAGAVYGAISAFMARDMNKRSAHASVSFSCVLFFMLFLRNETVTNVALILMIVHAVAIPLIFKYSVKTGRAV